MYQVELAAGPSQFPAVDVGLLSSPQTITSVEEGELFGEIGVLCNMPQPFMCRATQLAKVLRIERNDFSGVVQAYVKDGNQVVENLLQVG